VHEALLVLAILAAFFGGFALRTYLSRKKAKYDGYLNLSETDASQIFQLQVMTEPEELRTQEIMVLKIRKMPAEKAGSQ
jgi:hypothetical protein